MVLRLMIHNVIAIAVIIIMVFSSCSVHIDIHIKVPTAG
jgi:hypothetical protein